MAHLAVQSQFTALAGFALSLLLSPPSLAEPFVPNDPYFVTNNPAGFPGQWHLDRQSSGAAVDVNIRGAWNRGLTGQGVTIGIVEEGFDSTHPDLAANYSGADSWNFVTNSSDAATSSHGTAVAGVAAARGGNGIGVTGAAPEAAIANLIIDFDAPLVGLYSPVADEQTANAILYKTPEIAIRNHSYGFIIPWIAYPIRQSALEQSSYEGVINVVAAMNEREHHGKRVFVSGGGATAYDADVNKHAGTNIPEVIVVAAVGSNGTFASYSGFGANVFVTAPSLSLGFPAITTTDEVGEAGYNNSTGDASLNRSGLEDLLPDLDYTTRFSGTSSATPLVSGILALAKQVQPKLDARFAKHLLARTSGMVDASDSTPVGGWQSNGAGLHFNNNYGFGLIDADALTLAATQYSGVTPLSTYATADIDVSAIVPNNDDAGLARIVSVSNLGALEEVQVHLDVESANSSLARYFASGDLEATLVSPQGTTSRLMYRNDGDYWRAEGALNWTFTTNAFWGENPVGDWTLTLRDVVAGPAYDSDVIAPHWKNFSLTFRSGSLIPAGPGDFDADGDVDGNDFLVWQQNFGSTSNLVADDNHDGVVDAADYVLWRNHFGESSSSAASQMQVPEPTTLIMLLLSSFGSFVFRASLLRSPSK